MVRICSGIVLMSLLFQSMAWGVSLKITDIRRDGTGLLATPIVIAQYDPSNIPPGGVSSGSNSIGAYIYYYKGPVYGEWRAVSGTEVYFAWFQDPTWAEISSRLVAKLGRTPTLTAPNVRSDQEVTVCIGGGVSRINLIPMPGGCANDKVTPSLNWCKVNDGNDLTFSHGTLSSAQANGHQVVKTVTISCNDPATIKLRMLTADIPMGGTVTSVVTANGNVIDTNGLLLSGGDKDKSVVLGSTLKVGSKGESGLFSGSGTLLIEIQ